MDANAPLADNILFGSSQVMACLRGRAEKISMTDVPVLLVGDAGTGKETLARWIHSHSVFASGLFLKVNCAAIPGTLLESELFGYERGAFTGANASKPGRVEFAQNGTLFLDEIADCDTSVQTKLLHFLQDGRFSRIGSSCEQVVKTRVICSTSRNLDEEIAKGRFRLDLYYRISVVQLQLPRLRERREDIPLIAEFLRNNCERQFEKSSEPLSSEVLRLLESRPWPGNVRELANNIARYVLIGPETLLIPDEIARRSPKWVKRGRGEVVPLKRVASEAIRQLEKSVILNALEANQWNRRRTAKALQISYRSLVYKIRDAGLGSKRSIRQPSEGT